MTFGLSAGLIGGLLAGGGAIGSALIGGSSANKAANTQAQAANNAANVQAQMYGQGVDLQKQQFDKITSLLAPYVSQGTSAMTMQGNIAGANGNAAQQSAIDNIQNGPLFKSLNEQGQEAILRTAGATGGLRTGNTIGAVAQFSPQLLDSLIKQQYEQLGGLSTLGQNSAAMTGNAGMSMANSVSNLYGQSGNAQAMGINNAAAARAGGTQATGQMYQNVLGGIGQGYGMYNTLAMAPQYNNGLPGADFGENF